jgi:hypothetical protein
MRDRINDALKIATKARQERRMNTLRLIKAAIKDRDIDARGEGREAVTDAEILSIMQKMVRQREESAQIYDGAGRKELGDQEREEIGIIQEFLPQSLSEAEVLAAIDAAIAETGAKGLRDMGKVVNALKTKHPGRIDLGAASKTVKAKLGA